MKEFVVDGHKYVTIPKDRTIWLEILKGLEYNVRANSILDKNGEVVKCYGCDRTLTVEQVAFLGNPIEGDGHVFSCIDTICVYQSLDEVYNSCPE